MAFAQLHALLYIAQISRVPQKSWRSAFLVQSERVNHREIADLPLATVRMMNS